MGNLNDHLIDENAQKIVAEEYLQKNYAVINRGRPAEEPDSLTYTFDLEILEEYLAYIKQAANDAGITDIKIKITMGQYPENNPVPKQNPKYNGYQTIFLRGEDSSSNVISGTEGLNFSALVPPYS